MARVLVLYYSTCGHIETMAAAVAEGVRSGGATADIRRVPGTVTEENAKKSCFKKSTRPMTMVGLPYSHQGQMTPDEIVGGAPCGAITIAGGDGSRQRSAIGLKGARHQGELVARAAIKLHG